MARQTYTYPRKCLHCDYISNNPQMWYYHNQTHEPVPEGTICAHGCGMPATLKNTRGIFVCRKRKCPATSQRISAHVTENWKADSTGSGERRKQTRETFIKTTHNKEMFEKSLKTRYKNLLAQDNSKVYRHYRRQVYALTKHTLRKNASMVNPEGHELSRSGHHVDHKVSIHVGFLLGIPANYLSEVHNLQVMDAHSNICKRVRCSLHPLDLLEQCNAHSDVITAIHERISQLGDSIAPLLKGCTQNCETF